MTATAFRLTENAELASRTSIRVPARTACLAEVYDPAALDEVLSGPHAAAGTVILGEGSNTLFTRDHPGLVLCPMFRGLDDDGDGTVVVGAGENWHTFVHWSLEAGYRGLENLSLIPGSVGAAPIQNIGAYGTELDEFVQSVHAFDRVAGKMVELDCADCGFAYRDSLMKQDPDHYLVTRVVFALPRERPLQLDYAGVREELAVMGVESPTGFDVAQAVEVIRRRKLPDPATLANVGSFFKNPLVDEARTAELVGEHPAMPTWVADGATKLSAAWLIERCGLKGIREGDAGIAEGHALVLVNYGGATGVEIWALAQRVMAAVEARFGIRLEPEPRIL